MGRESPVLKPLVEFVESLSKKRWIAHVGRFLLVLTFLEDGLRLWLQWSDQSDYFRRTWSTGPVIAGGFIALNMVLQIAGPVLILLRKHVGVGVCMLLAVITMQTLAYSILWSMTFLMRNLALLGGLVLILAEAKQPNKLVHAGGALNVESEGERQKNYMVLWGRILVVLMFFTLIHGEMSAFRILFTLVNTGMIALVAVGLQTKLSSLALALSLFVMNFFFNNFWALPEWNPQRDFEKYDFFQQLSVAGGLLLLVSLGGGGISVDDRKKLY